MAQQMITLEEAAEKLGIAPEEMKKRLKTDSEFKRLSQIRDGSSVRFKLAAIEELARELGLASDPGLPLGPIGGDAPGSDDFKVAGFDPKKKPKPDDDAPLDFSSTDDDVFALTDDDPKPASQKKPKVDSDVRLDGGKLKKPKADESVIPTEEIALDFSGPGSAVIKGGSSAKLSAPRSGGSSGKLSDSSKNLNKPTSDSSEFELSLDADSDELEMHGDEVDLGAMPKDKGGSGKGGKSGINLRDPADSGISLEKGKKKGQPADESDADSDIDFELSLDSSSAASSSKLGAPKSGKLVLDSDSDSEFELTLDDSGGSSLEQAALGADQLDVAEDKGDIFETDFEIPPMPEESGSEAVAVDSDLEQSDFELTADDSDVAADEDSASEVVLLEDEDDTPKAKAKGKARKAVAEPEDVDVDLDDVDLEDEAGASAAGALKGVKGKKRSDDDDEDDDEDAVPAGATVERPTKPWGIVPVLFLAPTFLVVMLGAIMGYELLNTMWGYQQPRKPAAPVVRGIASMFGMELKDQ